MIKRCFHYAWIMVIAITLVANAWDITRMNLCNEAQTAQDMPCHESHQKHSKQTAQCCLDAMCHHCSVPLLYMGDVSVLPSVAFDDLSITSDQAIRAYPATHVPEHPPKILG